MSFRKDSDCYTTPMELLDIIMNKVDHGLVIWEPFYNDGLSGEYMRSKGFEVHHENKDFFTYEPPHFDIIVSNPPFSKGKHIFNRLKHLDKPWAMLVRLDVLANNYVKNEFDSKDLRIIIPKKRYGFIKDGTAMKPPNFELCWLTYKIGGGAQLVYA